MTDPAPRRNMALPATVQRLLDEALSPETMMLMPARWASELQQAASRFHALDPYVEDLALG